MISFSTEKFHVALAIKNNYYELELKFFIGLILKFFEKIKKRIVSFDNFLSQLGRRRGLFIDWDERQNYYF